MPLERRMARADAPVPHVETLRVPGVTIVRTGGLRGAAPPRSIESATAHHRHKNRNRLSPRSQMGHAPRKDLTHPVSRARTSDRNPGATGTTDGSCRRSSAACRDIGVPGVTIVRTGGSGVRSTPRIYSLAIRATQSRPDRKPNPHFQPNRLHIRIPKFSTSDILVR